MSILRPSTLWRAGAFFATSGIVCGAFGSHGLRGRVTPDQIRAWETASSYAIFNGITLFVLSMHPRFSVHRFAGPAIVTGTSLFAGSIFALVLNKERFRFLGPVTPLGGTFLIAGYLSLMF